MFFFFNKPKVVIRHRPEHTISRKLIAPEALKVLYRLSDAGYKAYLVGGGVRDLLLGCHPKDFDVGTDARPREIKRIFPRCFLVGKRFRLAHVVFGKTVIETSTFRKQPPPSSDPSADGDNLYQLSDNTFGTPEEDARRRDFTVNGLFYDIRTFDVIDYVGGLKDLDRKLLRSIGDPNIRFREDPVRMMRALRLSSKLGLTIEKGTFKAIKRHHAEIAKASVPRVLEEIFRLFSFSAAESSFRKLWEVGMLGDLLPELDSFVNDNGKAKCRIWDYLAQFDIQTKGRGDSVSNGLRLAVLYLAPFLAAIQEKGKDAGRERHRTRQSVAEDILQKASTRYKMPKSAVFHAVHLLQELSCFEKNPPQNKTIRASRAEQFADAIILARIKNAVEGRSDEIVDAWSRISVVPLPAHPSDADGDESKDAQASDPSQEETYERSGFRPRRRRFRSSRHRQFSRGAPADGAAQQGSGDQV